MAWMQTTLFIAVMMIFVCTAIVTLLGVSGRINIENKYLMPLMTSLLIEVAGAVLFLFKSINIDQETAEQFISQLPVEVQAEDAVRSRDLIVKLVQEQASDGEQLQQLAERNDVLTQHLQTLNQSLNEARDELAAWEALNSHPLGRLVTFHLNASKFGDTLNFTRPVPVPEEKKILARQFLSLLAELNFYNGEVMPDPAMAKAQLIKYQEAHGFSDTGWYSRYTFRIMANDYLGIGETNLASQ